MVSRSFFKEIEHLHVRPLVELSFRRSLSFFNSAVFGFSPGSLQKVRISTFAENFFHVLTVLAISLAILVLYFNPCSSECVNCFITLRNLLVDSCNCHCQKNIPSLNVGLFCKRDVFYKMCRFIHKSFFVFSY